MRTTAEKSSYLFVYGTLMKRYAANPFISQIERYASYVSTAFTCGELYVIDFYPGLVPTSNALEKVYGEIFEVRDAVDLFNILDAYEDYDPMDEASSLYIRRKVEVFTGVQSPDISAWTYVFNRPVESYTKIKSGNFLDVISSI